MLALVLLSICIFKKAKNEHGGMKVLRVHQNKELLYAISKFHSHEPHKPRRICLLVSASSLHQQRLGRCSPHIKRQLWRAYIQAIASDWQGSPRDHRKDWEYVAMEFSRDNTIHVPYLYVYVHLYLHVCYHRHSDERL